MARIQRRKKKRAAHAGRRQKRRGPVRLVGALGVLLLGLLLVRGFSGASAAGGIPREGQPVPDLKVRTLTGDPVVLSELAGNVVLVNFWATWCPPCRAEMPGFERVWREYRGAGLVVVGLAADEAGGRRVAAFLEDQGITYPVAMANASVQAAFGGVNGLPMSFLVDRRGVIQRVVTGFFDESLLRRDVSRLLRQSP